MNRVDLKIPDVSNRFVVLFGMVALKYLWGNYEIAKMLMQSFGFMIFIFPKANRWIT